LAELVNIPKKVALDAISTHPGNLLQKIEMIRDPNYIMSGIKVISLKKEGNSDEY
jgi:hypothetical protein